jgi:hypothetical protein
MVAQQFSYCHFEKASISASVLDALKSGSFKTFVKNESNGSVPHVSNNTPNYYHDEYEEEKCRLFISFDNDALHSRLHERERQQVYAKYSVCGYINRSRFIGRYLA